MVRKDRRTSWHCLPGRHGRAGRPGQVWSLDYSLAFFLFLVAFLLAISVLARTVLRADDFPELHDGTEALGEHLMGTGYPEYWRLDNLVSVGLLSDGKLSMRKTESLLALTETDYEASKGFLNTRHEWALSFEDGNGTIIPIADQCVIGSPEVTQDRTPSERGRSIGYYGTSNRLLSNLTGRNVTVSTPASLADFLDSLPSYEIAILEEPELETAEHPYDAEKAEALEGFVREGGILFIIGELNLTEAFSLNLTLVNTTADALSQATNDTFLNLSGVVSGITEDGWALKEHGEYRYERLAALGDGRDYAARFSYGDGDVYFLGGLNGSMNDTGEPLLGRVGRSIAAQAGTATASCAGLELPDARNRIAVRRLVAFHGKILILTIYAWDLR